MNRQKTIIIDDAVPYAQAIFSHLGKVITVPGKEINAETVKDADALIIRSRTMVNKDLLADSSVKFVGSTVVGLDHVDQDYLEQNNIHFYSAQGCNANSVAEFIITVLFDLAERFEFDLSSKTLGIIGVGNVGQRVYKKAATLGIKCLLNDPPKLLANPDLAGSHPYHDLETCLKADIITVHTPLTDKGAFPTVNLLSKQQLATITPDQIIINAARGGVIDEQAWAETKTKANIIDCWVNEPNINETLYKTAYLATPHIAGHSLDAKVAGSTMVYHELCNFWSVAEFETWKTELPEAPETIQLQEQHSIQASLNELFTHTHNIHKDDMAIRDANIENTHKKYEYYRRNYPVYREWHQQKVKTTNNKNLNNLLISLGFTLD